MQALRERPARLGQVGGERGVVRARLLGVGPLRRPAAERQQPEHEVRGRRRPGASPLNVPIVVDAIVAVAE